ncbi:HAD family hydrolase [[Mycoplasma] gypis]|uniref:HAD family hydrolase n=1 Tax=[Mycoplasma] gypis TaxID=92404 RepID=A0ABZ2RNE2_9BACT|nr:HAD family hydrolase [[Mycoplasma] gypis]MBN0919328.1 HAD family hydrolase [[Mycoplasma] gypis]
MNLKNLKYFIFDLDGTLLNSQKQIDPRTLQTIINLKKQGKKFSINTGRTPFLSLQFMDQIKPDFPCSFCNGALIYDWKTKTFISKNQIGIEDAKKAFNVLIEQKATTLVYTQDKIYYKKFMDESKWIQFIQRTNDLLEPQYRGEVKEIDLNTFKLEDHEVYKIICITDEVVGDLSVIRKELDALKDCYPLQSNSAILDIIPKNIDKGTGLQYLVDNGYVNLDETCVFGDENNDVPMFKVAKYSTALGQARDIIKEQVTFVTESNDNNGIGLFLEKTV